MKGGLKMSKTDKKKPVKKTCSGEKHEGRKKLWEMIEDTYLASDIESLQKSFANHLEYSQAKTRYSATDFDCYKSLAYSIRDRLMEKWNDTQEAYYNSNGKRVYYLSMEFLMGRALCNNLINLGIKDDCYEALCELGYNLEELRELEPDAGLGNGGLGRLAACFLDSMATLQLPGCGYGIRYEYGIFEQKIEHGFQIERPDNWLRFGNPWEIVRPEYTYNIEFYGTVNEVGEWVNTNKVLAIAYDTPITGYKNDTVNNLRLWSSKATEEFALECFNKGDYIKAVQEKITTENISKVLYPKDDIVPGKELRLKQEYFFVSATLQDILRRYRVNNKDFDDFSSRSAIQLNDTHPAIAIPEFMRLLVDKEGMPWDKAWDLCVKTFAYTNHTILPEALEKWPVELLGKLLPRHLQIIYEINRRFLEKIKELYPGDTDRLTRMSIIEETPVKSVRMAYLAIVGSHSINGVAALHTEIIKDKLFRDFYDIWPEKFNNKTNGITQRRWLKLCNVRLSDLISKHIGEGWVTDLYELKKLMPLAEDKKFRAEWKKVKEENKKDLAEYIKKHNGIDININSIFDCQIKRLHEYKRQLLNVLHIITLYNRIKSILSPADFVPRTFIFGAKAAPGYYMAKLIIKLINSVAQVVNNDPDVGDKIKVVFLENYGVSLAEKIFPASDLSEQISTAGMEASGTGNMKFALNGALTIGTLDGANVEIKEEVGAENIFIFGLKTEEVNNLRDTYKPADYYNGNSELKQVIDMIGGGYFNPENRELFKPIVEDLLWKDYFMVLADYASYVECQEQVSLTFKNQEEWTEKSIINTACTGKFSSDRTIKEYAEEIWHVKPVKPKKSSNYRNR